MFNLQDPSLLITHSLIGGAIAIGNRYIPVVNPATEQALTSVSLIESEMLPEALAKAIAAQMHWAELSGYERGAVLRRWGELLLHHKSDLARILTLEQGKPLAEAAGEISYSADYFHWFAGEAERVYGRVLPAEVGARRWVEMRPLGVVAAITPWNFPAAMLARKLAAALAAGNAVLAKPAIQTPLTALALVQLGVRAGLPAELVSVLLTDTPEVLGEWLCSEPKIAKISFTGSTRVGKWLLARAGAQIKPCTMELGGNAPFIVFADANLPAAVSGFMHAKFRNAGQTCISANRLLLQKSIADEFLTLLKDKLTILKIGDGLVYDSQVGPLIHHDACNEVAAKIREAQTQGATVEIFGQDIREQKTGSFVFPMLVTGVAAPMRLFREESFGPVVAVTEFFDVQEAVQLANQTEYGLAAYLYSNDLTTISLCQRHLQFGMLGINEARLSHVNAPFGGIKNSGFGREGGAEGISHYLSPQYIAWNN